MTFVTSAEVKKDVDSAASFLVHHSHAYLKPLQYISSVKKTQSCTGESYINKDPRHQKVLKGNKQTVSAIQYILEKTMNGTSLCFHYRLTQPF